MTTPEEFAAALVSALPNATIAEVAAMAFEDPNVIQAIREDREIARKVRDERDEQCKREAIATILELGKMAPPLAPIEIPSPAQHEAYLGPIIEEGLRRYRERVRGASREPSEAEVKP